MADFFNNSIEGYKALLKATKELKKELTDIVKLTQEEANKVSPAKAKAEDINKLVEAEKDLINVEKQLAAITKEELKWAKKINEAEGETGKIRAENQIILQNQIKKNKQEAKENLGLIGAYKKKNDHLRDLKNTYKDLIAAEGKTTKQTKRLKKEINQLDKELVDLDNSVGDSFRNIGKYEKALEGTKKQMLKLAAAGAAVSGAMAGINSSFEDSEEGSEDLRVASGKMEVAMNIAKNTTASAALDLLDFGKALWDGEKSLGDITEAFGRTEVATENLGDKWKEATESRKAATLAEIELEKISRGLRKEVALLNGEIEKQGEIAGDTTLGMDSIAEANERAIVAEKSRNTILVGLAEQELKIIEDQIAARSKGSNNLALLNAQAEKEIELIDLRSELLASTLKLEKEINVNNRDRFEKALDFALDLFDTQKTLNERGIDDETKTFNERVKLLNRTKDLSNDAFEEQTRLAEKQVEARIKLNELVAEDDEKVIFARISALTTDEIVQQRLLDIIRDRKTAILDLAEAERDLNLAIKERGEEDAEMNAEEAQKLEDSANALAQFRLELAAETATEIDDIEQKSIDAAIFRSGILLNNEELNADDRILIEEQLQAEIAAIQKQAIEDKLEQDKAYLEETLEFANQITSELGDQLNERLDNQANALDEEQGRIETSIDRQKNLASQGLENTLVEEEERLKENQIKKLDQEKKAAQVEEAIRLGKLFLTLKEAEAQEQVDGSTARALQGVAESKAIVAGIKASLDLAGFEKGGLVEGGEQIIRINEKGKEFVIDAPTTSALGLDKAGSSMDNFKQMMLEPNMDKFSGNVMNPNQNNNDNSAMVNVLNEINDKPVQMVNIDELGNIIETSIKRGQRTVTKFKTRSRL
jgi:hypothetical protein